MSTAAEIQNVLVTGATGFVGRSVVRELLSRGLTPVCLVRSPNILRAQHKEVDPTRIVSVIGRLSDHAALQEAADLSQAAIHLVGIIIQRRLSGATFHRVHVEGTRNVVDALTRAGVKRLTHISALGARPDAVSAYHQSKWAGEQLVRQSELDWTIFRPSIIHGPDGEFMQLMKAFVCGLNPPMIPYFGAGKAKIQPVSVKDVAFCIVESLFKEESIGQCYSMGGPVQYSWTDLYNTCRRLLPRGKRWKPMVSLPIPVATTIAYASAPPLALAELMIPSLRKFRFDAGQVAMSQEDAVCDHTAVESAFELKMRSFQDELSIYGERI